MFRDTTVQEAELRKSLIVLEPVWPSAPQAAAFTPLVFLLAFAMPILHATTAAWLTPTAAGWALRGLDVIESGDWLSPGDPAHHAPPILALSEAAALSLPGLDPHVAARVPAGLFGAGSCFLLYRLGAVWYTPATGLLASFLLVCNDHFLEELRHSGFGLVVMFFTLGALVAFVEHLDRQDEAFSRWTLLGGLSLAGLILSIGASAGWISALGVTALFVRQITGQRAKLGATLQRVAADATARGGVLTVILGVCFCLPWLLRSGFHAGPLFPWSEPEIEFNAPKHLWQVVKLMPAVFVLSMLGFMRSLREVWRVGPGAERDVLPVFWILLSAASLQFFQPSSGAALVLTASLLLAASRAVLDILQRKVDDRTVFALAAVDALLMTTLLTGDTNLSRSLRMLAAISAAAAVGSAAWWLLAWSAHRDERRRAALGGLVLIALVLACAPGLRRLHPNSTQDEPLAALRFRLQAIVESNPPDAVVFHDRDAVAQPAVYDSRTSAARFALRTALPKVPHLFANDRTELDRCLLANRKPLLLVFRGVKPLPRTYTASAEGRTRTLSRRLENPHFAVYFSAESTRR